MANAIRQQQRRRITVPKVRIGTAVRQIICTRSWQVLGASFPSLLWMISTSLKDDPQYICANLVPGPCSGATISGYDPPALGSLLPQHPKVRRAQHHGGGDILRCQSTASLAFVGRAAICCSLSASPP